MTITLRGDKSTSRIVPTNSPAVPRHFCSRSLAAYFRAVGIPVSVLLSHVGCTDRPKVSKSLPKGSNVTQEANCYFWSCGASNCGSILYVSTLFRLPSRTCQKSGWILQLQSFQRKLVNVAIWLVPVRPYKECLIATFLPSVKYIKLTQHIWKSYQRPKTISRTIPLEASAC